MRIFSENKHFFADNHLLFYYKLIIYPLFEGRLNSTVWRTVQNQSFCTAFQAGEG